MDTIKDVKTLGEAILSMCDNYELTKMKLFLITRAAQDFRVLANTKQNPAVHKEMFSRAEDVFRAGLGYSRSNIMEVAENLGYGED